MFCPMVFTQFIPICRICMKPSICKQALNGARNTQSQAQKPLTIQPTNSSTITQKMDQMMFAQPIAASPRVQFRCARTFKDALFTPDF